MRVSVAHKGMSVPQKMPMKCKSRRGIACLDGLSMSIAPGQSPARCLMTQAYI
jgi:hypothetical protein